MNRIWWTSSSMNLSFQRQFESKMLRFQSCSLVFMMLGLGLLVTESNGCIEGPVETHGWHHWRCVRGWLWLRLWRNYMHEEGTHLWTTSVPAGVSSHFGRSCFLCWLSPFWESCSVNLGFHQLVLGFQGGKKWQIRALFTCFCCDHVYAQCRRSTFLLVAALSSWHSSKRAVEGLGEARINLVSSFHLAFHRFLLWTETEAMQREKRWMLRSAVGIRRVGIRRHVKPYWALLSAPVPCAKHVIQRGISLSILRRNSWLCASCDVSANKHVEDVPAM